jgi:hypothetical protein
MSFGYLPAIVYFIGSAANIILRYRLLNNRKGYTAGRKLVSLTDERRSQIIFDFWFNFIFLTAGLVVCSLH